MNNQYAAEGPCPSAAECVMCPEKTMRELGLKKPDPRG